MFRQTNKPSQPAQDGQTYAPPAAPAPRQVVVPTVPANGPQDTYAPNTSPGPSQDQPYNFITNPEPPPKQPLMSRLPGGNSIAIRVGLLAGGLLVLFILFSIIKGVFSSDSGLATSLVSVVQDQQELIHLATNASQQEGISTINQNSASTMQLSLTTSQANLVKYLAGGHKKINDKTANLKVSKSIDGQLAAAVAATTYDQTFQEIVQTKLTDYKKDLQQAYKLEPGKKGRALLTDTYRQAQLLQVQLNATTD